MTYQPEPGQSTCENCPARFYCDNEDGNGDLDATKAQTPIICPAGYYCTERTEDPVECPSGTFNIRTGLASEAECESCSPGYYCPSAAMDEDPDDNSYLCQEG
jgi:hypothetical protein